MGFTVFHTCGCSTWHLPWSCVIMSSGHAHSVFRMLSWLGVIYGCNERQPQVSCYHQSTMYVIYLPRGPEVAALFCCLVHSSLNSGGGPKRLRVLLEGESLLNDASGLTLFEVFFHIVSIPASLLLAAVDCAPVITPDPEKRTQCSSHEVC